MTKRRKRPVYVRVELEDAPEYQQYSTPTEETMASPPDVPDRSAVEHVIYDLRSTTPQEITD